MKNIIFNNYTNYIYKVNQLSDTKTYLLFNPSIHYWITIDEIGKAICEQLLSENTLSVVKEKLIELFQINDSIYEEDVLPYIQELIRRKFFAYEPTSQNAEFMNETAVIPDIDSYPFNDMYISLSDYCNLNCIYCFNKEKRKAQINSENYKPLTFEEICDAVLQFKALGGKRIVLTGGEPTLNKDFEKLCQFIHANELKVHFITNGLTLLNKDFNEIFPYVSGIGISLDSVFNDELNTLWGICNDKISDEILSVLNKLDRWSQENSKISVSIMPISSKINHRSMAKIIHTVAVNLSHCNLNWQIVKYGKINNPFVDELLDITNAEYRISIIDGLSSICSDKSHVDFLRYAYSSSGRIFPFKKPNIYTCVPSFFITTTGDIKPCQGLDSIDLGNIRSKTLKEAFNSDGFAKVHKITFKNNIDICKDCELRFVCASEKRECFSNKNLSVDECREKIIYQMYLETLNGVETND